MKKIFVKQVNHWISQKAPIVDVPWQIHNRRIFILPTKHGMYYGFLTLIMLLCAINYGNSLAFMLSFFLTSIGLVSLYQTHANLLNLKINKSQNIPPVFVGNDIEFSITVENLKKIKKHSLFMHWQGEKINQFSENQMIDVNGFSKKKFNLVLEAKKRGVIKAPRFVLKTNFPLGISQSWSWVGLNMECLVYPKPLDLTKNLNAFLESPESLSRQEIKGKEEFHSLREYQKGDSWKLINWKILSKSRKILVKEFVEQVGGEIWLDWDSLPSNLSYEEKISCLTQLVIDMEKENINYGMKTPYENVVPSNGNTHYHNCLKKLALHP